MPEPADAGSEGDELSPENPSRRVSYVVGEDDPEIRRIQAMAAAGEDPFDD